MSTTPEQAPVGRAMGGSRRASAALRMALVSVVAASWGACGTTEPASPTDTSDAEHDATHDGAGPDTTSVDSAVADAPQGLDSHDGGAASGAPCAGDSDCAGLNGPCGRGSCVAAKCVHLIWADATACDDQDPCTLGETCSAGVCQGGGDACGCAADGDCDALSAGDACSGTLSCVAKGAPDGVSGLCAVKPGSRTTCPAGDNPCAVNTCDPKTGACVAKPVQGAPACSDGNPCTGGTTCTAGTCGGGVELCSCTSDKDCATLQDATTWRCTGTWYCDLKGDAPTCKLDPASVVTCPAGKAGACLVPTCDPADGACTAKARPDKSACDDGNLCTGTDLCVGGVCQGEQNICPCTSDDDCTKQDDGDPCNGTLYCDVLAPSPTCEVQPGTVVVCDTSDDGPCAKTACDAQTGECTQTPLSGPSCDDGSPCTASDSCKGGECVPGTPVCACTSDSDCVAKNPANKCLGTLYCDQSQNQCVINPATVVHCPNGSVKPCTANVCQPTTGVCAVVALADDTPCDADGNPCTQGDVCAKGSCKVGQNVCLCSTTPDCGKYEDGDVCNGTLYCDTSKLPLVCEVNPATVITCPTGDDTACTQRRCQKKTGLCPPTPVNQLASCDADGSVCTAGDFCLDGTCTAGTNTCACTTDSDCAGKEDGDLCNGTLFCDKTTLPFTCSVNPATVVSCLNQPFGPCEEPVCLPKSGSCTTAALPDNLPCDDGEPCTLGDVCKSGACASGLDVCACKKDADCAALNPKDKCLGTYTCNNQKIPHVCEIMPLSVVSCPTSGDPCFGWTCNGATGDCDKTLTKSGTPCDDGDACTPVSSCLSGTCAGKAKDCSDSAFCTLDYCDSKGVCQHDPIAAAPCDDGDKCTGAGTCDQGTCKPGAPLKCTDGEDCTTDTCDKIKGCTHVATSDGGTCTTADGGVGSCASGVCAAAP